MGRAAGHRTGRDLQVRRGEAQAEGSNEYIRESNQRRVFDLDRPKQAELFERDNSVNESTSEITSRVIKEEEPSESFQSEPSYSFVKPVNRLDDEDEEDDLFRAEDDEFEISSEDSQDQMINDDGLMEIHDTRDRLRQASQERVDRLKRAGRYELNAHDLKERLDVPAYLRRDINLQSVPHSSEPHVSKYNLNDDNQILGNNRFLHDNVD